MTDIAEDATIEPGSRPWPRRRWSSGRCRSGTGRRSPATSATPSPAADTAPALLVYGADVVVAGPADAAHPDRRLVRPLRGHDVARGRARHRDRTAARRRAGRGDAVRRTRRRGHDLASVTLACAVRPGSRVTLAYGSVGPRPWLVTDASGACRPGLVRGGATGRAGPAVRGRRTVADLDACQPVPPRDAPRARAASDRDRSRRLAESAA